MKKWLCFGLLSLAFALASPVRSSAAEFSIAGGAFVSTSPSQTGGAVLLSSAASVPSLPIEVQGTILVPVTNQGGYAVTAEVRGLSGGGFGGAYIGGGLGIGVLSADRQYGPVLTLFVGKPVGPSTTIELRAYKGTRTNGTTAGFLGLRFTF